ncbi:MAG: hypothetical protein OQL18_06355 [Deltaproteobacteria bacterium]|nr:hypothetical protein [Deltaproteobacteria bacterium]
MNLPEYQSTQKPSQRRLGECLLAEGLINSGQLDEAIEYQCIYGGKLGTSLIELGLADEEQMAKILSQQLRLHYIKPELLMNVPGSVLNLVPDKIALKYQVVPYHEDGKKLYVAINDVTNLKVIDDLSFQLNHIIIPLAIPEIRLMLALKKHYGMLLTPRYETLAVQMSRRNLAAKKIAPKQPEVKTEQTSESATEPDEQEPLADEVPWPLLGDEEYAGEEQIEDSYFSATPVREEEKAVDLLHLLAEAKERDDIARAIIDYLKPDFPIRALFMVRGDNVFGWLASGEKPQQLFEQLSISLHVYSVFSPVATNHSYYLGPVVEAEQNLQFLNFFDSRPPQNALAVPLLVQDRLVSILYVQGQIDKLEQSLAELQYIAGKAEMAFKLLILKNKILSS